MELRFTHWGIIEVILYWVNVKENGNYYNGIIKSSVQLAKPKWFERVTHLAFSNSEVAA